MKSNYMKSAEIKIAKNPNMDYYDKYLLRSQARQKERKLREKLGMANSIYITTDSSSLDWMNQYRNIFETVTTPWTMTATINTDSISANNVFITDGVYTTIDPIIQYETEWRTAQYEYNRSF